MEWDDVRLLLAVARSLTLAKAAQQLKTSHSTISRRLASLETRSSVKLFVKTAAGHTLTEAGRDVYESALKMEEHFLALARHVISHDAPSEQPVRVSAPDVLVNHLASYVRAFRKREPSILVEFDVDNAPVDLNRLEADIVLRASRAPQAHLVGTRIAQTAWAAYVAKSEKHPALNDHRLAWIGYGGVLAQLPVTQWMRETVPKERIALCTNSSVAAQVYARAGLGAACLWCLAGDSDPELVRLTPPLHGIASDLWLLTHPDLRRSRRIAKVRTFLARALRSDHNFLEGKKFGTGNRKS